jgi:hypothetical protein
MDISGFPPFFLLCLRRFSDSVVALIDPPTHARMASLFSLNDPLPNLVKLAGEQRMKNRSSNWFWPSASRGAKTDSCRGHAGEARKGPALWRPVGDEIQSATLDNDGLTWHAADGGRIFDANTDRDTVVEHHFANPFVASIIRLEPIEAHTQC